MPNTDLFTWWALSISFSSVFLTLISIYLYSGSMSKRRENAEEVAKTVDAVRLVKSFAFVWVLLGLLVFYIFSVQLGAGILSEAVFALGNIAVEVLLVFYLLRSRDKTPTEDKTKSDQT